MRCDLSWALDHRSTGIRGQGGTSHSAIIWSTVKGAPSYVNAVCLRMKGDNALLLYSWGRQCESYFIVEQTEAWHLVGT